MAIFIFPDGSLYEGGFLNSMFSGYGGLENNKKKVKYVGQWANGQPHGLGE